MLSIMVFTLLKYFTQYHWVCRVPGCKFRELYVLVSLAKVLAKLPISKAQIAQGPLEPLFLDQRRYLHFIDSNLEPDGYSTFVNTRMWEKNIPLRKSIVLWPVIKCRRYHNLSATVKRGKLTGNQAEFIT